MEVYEFDKSLLERLEESMSVLSWKEQAIPASQVRSEWSYFIELQIEPAGWQALWKIPRVICEDLHLRFPTVVYGNVEQVLFRELKAVFVVLAVQNDDVHLPERQEVSLENLYPTRDQENEECNAEHTADCLDRLRFFYTHVWMPWDNDNDDDLNWVEKHLRSRIRFCYDLRKHSMKRALAGHIRTLLSEAKYIQQRREYLEIGLSDDEELDDTLDKSQITDLMRLHLRLAMIRSEIEMLENPELRHIYEEIKFDDEKHLKSASASATATGTATAIASITERLNSPQRVCYVVTALYTLDRQIELLQMAQQQVPENALVQICPSLQDVLSICNASDSIYLSPGQHTFKFLEYLNDSGRIVGLTSDNKDIDKTFKMPDVIVMSHDNDSILLVFDGDFTLENLVVDCKNVRVGILVKNGEVCLKDCRLIGDGKSTTQEGIVCAGSGKINLQNCLIEHFATGIILKDGTEASVLNTQIRHCPVGVQLGAHDTRVFFKSTTIWDSTNCGIYVDAIPLRNPSAKHLVLKEFSDLSEQSESKMSSWTGDCTFKQCKANMFIVNEKRALISSQTLKSLLDGNEEGNAPAHKELAGSTHSGTTSENML